MKQTSNTVLLWRVLCTCDTSIQYVHMLSVMILLTFLFFPLFLAVLISKMWFRMLVEHVPGRYAHMKMAFWGKTRANLGAIAWHALQCRKVKRNVSLVSRFININQKKAETITTKWRQYNTWLLTVPWKIYFIDTF